MNIATNAEVYSVTEFLTHSQAMKWVGPRIHTLDPFWQGVSKAVPCRFQIVRFITAAILQDEARITHGPLCT